MEILLQNSQVQIGPVKKILRMNQTRIYEALNHLNRKRHMEILYGFI